MKAKLLLFAAPLALAGFSPAHATVTFGDQTLNNGTVLENVLIANNQTATTVTGQTNNTHATVYFTSPTDTLVTTASGQAVITAVDELLNAVTISLALRTKSPIWVAKKVLEASSVLQQMEEGKEQNLSNVSRDKWAEILEKMAPEDFKYKM